MRSAYVVLLCALAACTTKAPPPEAPAEIDDLSKFMFSNFDDDTVDDGYDDLVLSVPVLEAFIDGYDLTGDVDERSITLTPLEKSDWGDIQGSADTNPADQLPVAVMGVSTHDLQAHIDLQAEPNHVCIESESTKYYARTFVTDVDCFTGGSCETLETTNEVRKESILAKVWYDLNKDYRTVALADGRQVMFARSWIEQVYPADGGSNSWNQLYTLEAWIPDGKGSTKRYYAYWSEIVLGGTSDNFLIGEIKDGIDQGFQWSDGFIDGDTSDCKNDRDRPYDRP